jgi:predicted porin
MKKTIVAAAVAAVFAAPAMADVSISGQINFEMYDNNSADGYVVDENADVFIKGSEDLGNGMKAFFTMNTSPDGAGASLAEDDRYVGISGDFGSLTFGRIEGLLPSKVTTFVDNDAADSQTVEIQTGSASRQDGTIRYTSPNFNGVTFAVEGVSDNDVGTDDTSNFDLVTTYVSYSNAGLTVSAAQENHTDANKDLTAIAVSYTMGDIQLNAVRTSSDVAATGDATVIGAKYTMGANDIVVNYVTSDDNTTSTDGDSIITLRHAMSKNTNVYVALKNDDNGEDTTLVGLKHSF